MSKADCERFDSTQDVPPSSVFAGQAIAKNGHEAPSEDVNSRIKAFMEKAEVFSSNAKTVSHEAWNELKPGLDNAWDDLCQAWYELKMATQKAVEKLH
jgi:hypothetical protein